MRNFFSVLLFSLCNLFVFANDAEQARILVHTLNYISHDYYYAVRDGKVISEDEYEEELEFAEDAVKYFKKFSPAWNHSEAAEIGIAIYRLDSLIHKRAPFEVVSALATETKNKVIAASGLEITPMQYPNLQNGKIIYKTECAKCHGENGFGDGIEGKELNPKPRNFMDDAETKTISPFGAFNTIRLGVEGTGMKPITTLDDNEVWDVAFYVVSLRYQSLANNSRLKDESIQKLIDSISLKTIATHNDEELLASLNLKDASKEKLFLASLRLRQPKVDKTVYINTALRYLDGAFDLYKQGKFDEAAQLVSLSYLEGIQPIEVHAKANDPALVGKLEDQIQTLKRIMNGSRSTVEVKDSLNKVRETVHSVKELLAPKSYSFWLAFAMAASILLREGLEAFLVIMVILSVAKVAGMKNSAQWVHAGWIFAVLSGIVLWLIGGVVISAQKQNFELVEGVISLVAVVMLLYIGFWLHGKSEINKWKEYVSKKVQGAVNSESNLALALLSFFVVFREVFESVLFLSTLNIESGGKQISAIALGVISAFVAVIVLAFFVLKFSAKLPIPQLFKISSFAMGILAVILAGKGIHSLQEANLISIHGIAIPRIQLLGIYPTIETCVTQIIVLLVFFAVWMKSNKK